MASYPYSGYTFDEWVKREFIMPPARRKRKITAQRIRAEIKKLQAPKTRKELKRRLYLDLRLLDECLPQVPICRVRTRRRKRRNRAS